MPWKVFTQSLALTDFGDKLTNEQFIQRQNTSYYLNIAPKWGDSVFELFLLPSGDPFQGHTKKVGAY